MNPFTSADLAFERRVKGHFPVTRFAVSDAGDVTIIVPDDHQPRLYHVLRVNTAGDWSELGKFSVEKLQRIDFSKDARVLVAMTDDDAYVFREGAKTRFFTDRRDNYAAVSMSASGDLFAVGSADMILSSYSVTLANTSGGQEWVKDVPFIITCARISADGSRILVGAEEGIALMLDKARSDVWRFEGGSVTALATSPTGDVSVIGARAGSVHAIGESGNLLWEIAREGRIVDCAMSDDAKLTVVARETTGGGSVEFLSDDGAPVIEHEAPSKIASVSCSPNGSFTAVSCEDGMLQVLEITQAAMKARASESADALRAEALSTLENGDYPAAVGKLTRYLGIRPGDADACRKLIEAKDALVAARGRTISDALAEANSLAQAGRLEDALSKAEEILQLDFTNVPARELLGRVEDDLAAKCLADADAALGKGEFAEAVRLLERAAAIRPTSEVRDRIAKARAESAFREGVALYDAKKYPQAAFQFRKVLSVEPENAEARKYLEYAESLRQDETIFDRFSKLE